MRKNTVTLALVSTLFGCVLGTSVCNRDAAPSRADACRKMEQTIVKFGAVQKNTYDGVLPRNGKLYNGESVDELEAGAQRRIDRAVAESYDRCLALSDTELECLALMGSLLDAYFAEHEHCNDSDSACWRNEPREDERKLQERCGDVFKKVYCEWPGEHCTVDVPKAR